MAFCFIQFAVFKLWNMVIHDKNHVSAESFTIQGFEGVVKTNFNFINTEL
ncbi:MAG: hypothetical protein RL065_1694 [Bacteroidota bacterium]|jgi:hypothetical protein